MTQKYDWGAIRDRYESGETSGAISKSLGEYPTRQGIEKRAKREGWLKISKSAKEAVRNLPSIQNPTFPRAPSEELGKYTVENAQIILSAFECAVSPKIAAGLVGLTQGQLKKWMDRDHQFAMEIRSRAAQIAAEQVKGIWDSDDWRALKWLLERTPFSREEYGPQQSKNEGPQVILNIHRDEVVVEQPPIEVTLERGIESSPEPSILESSDVTDNLEAAHKKKCWQGDDWREKKTMAEIRAREERLALGIKTR